MADGAPELRPRTRVGGEGAARAGAAGVLRRLGRPLPLAGVVLVLLSLVGYWSVYRATTGRTAVLVAARPLLAGTRLRPEDLRSVELAGDGAVLGAFVPEAALGRVLGRRLAGAIPRGLPLAWAQLASGGALPAALMLVVPLLHALGGALAPGERVSVLATFERATGGAETRAIARGLELLAVERPAGALDPTSATVALTVALPDPSLASALALADAEGKIDLVRDGAGGATAAIPPASEGVGG